MAGAAPGPASACVPLRDDLSGEMDRKKGCASWISPINPTSNKALILEEEVCRQRHCRSRGYCCSAEPSPVHYLSLLFSFRTTPALVSTRDWIRLVYYRSVTGDGFRL